MSNEYIRKETIKKLNNYQLLKFTTEHYTQFIYFLKLKRNYKEITLKIGNFDYDEWTADIYITLKNNIIKFKHIRREDKEEWSHKTLTEQLIYAWGFEEIKFNINFDIINDFFKLLNKEEQSLYDSLYDDVHCEFW